MQIPEIETRIQAGEDSTTQFKQDMRDANRLAEEMVAFSNAQGGLLLIGVADDGGIVGLEDEQIARLNQLISNTANENVKPPVYPLTEILTLQGKRIIVVSIRCGSSRPYQTSKGLFLTKSGSDKRKMSSEELRRLFAESSRLFADEEVLPGSSLGDLNTEQFYDFLNRDNPVVLDELKQFPGRLPTVLQNLDLLREGQLTLAGNLIFGKLPQKFAPSFYVDCVHFDGNDVSAPAFIAKSTVKGTLSQQYEATMLFLRANLRRVPLAEGFNAQTTLEVDERVLTELLVNALVHRDYYIQSSIKVFVFGDRIELISPGKLANSLTVEKIRSGISIHRNPILNSVCKNVLPYSGYGSGIRRAVSLLPNIAFENDVNGEVFRCVIPR